jgi:hypothetical protein
MMANQSGRKKAPRVADGMQVLGADSDHIGFVREVEETAFLLYSPALGPVLVPYSAIDWISDVQVRLQVKGEKIGEMGWTVLIAVPMPSSSLGR